MFFPEIPPELAASFAAVKPEDNSAVIYDGAGSEPMLDASTTWSELAAAIGEVASTLHRANGQLRGAWEGESANWIAETAAQHRAWLWTAYQRAKLTAKAAQGVADAYTRVYKSVVPPDDIAANRQQLEDAKKKNGFGVDATEIAALEEEYQGFWVRDAEAMNTYAGEVLAQLSKVVPFGEAPQIVAPSSD